MLLLSSADIFQNQLFQEHYQHERWFRSAGLDLGPNCLQRLSAASKERVNPKNATKNLQQTTFSNFVYA